jgi:hypothetical protein
MKPLRLLSSLVLLVGAAVAQTNPVPLIYQPLIPMTVKPGSNQFTLTINGTGFASTAVVMWNGSTRITGFISSRQLQAQISAADVATPGTTLVSVMNPAPGGGTSNAVFFPIQTPAPSAGFFPASGFAGSGVSVAGDFNNDGVLDLAVAQNSGGFFINTYIGKGDGTFEAPFPNHSVTPVVSMITGDFNGDGLLDLAVLDGIGNITIFRNHAFSPLPHGGIFIQQQVFHSPDVRGGVFGGLATGDFNGDGKLDLVATGISYNYATSPSIDIFLGNGDGTFGSAIPIGDSAPGGGFGTPAVGDFNGDGKLDLAVAGGTQNAGPGVFVFLGNGDGTFQPGVIYTASGLSAAVADINGDGKLDIITDGVSVLLGNGDGTFTSAGGVPINGNSGPLLGDFNGDGKLDVAVLALNPNQIDLLLGNGNGTFQNPTQVATDNAITLAIGDFNGDGKLDLVGTSLYLQSPINLIPASLDFGTQNVGTKSPPQNVTVLNDGKSTLTITGINIGGNDPNDFTETNKCGSTLAVGANCQIAVVFQPQVGGARSATLKVNYQGPGSPQTVSLSGLGAVSTVTLTPSNLKFPLRLIGTTSSPKTATLTNTGSVPVNISNISTTGPFTETNNCPSSLAVGTNCQIQVKFTPVEKGLATGNLSVADDAKGSPQIVTLSGTGMEVKLSLVAINFGNQKVGTHSMPAPVKLTNVGTTALTIHQIAFKGNDPGDFSQTNNCGSSVPAGGSCTIQVTFTPQAIGKRSASLQVSDNGGGSPQKVALAGTGI